MKVKEENEKAGIKLSSVQFSSSVVSDSLQPHGLQHARPPCPSRLLLLPSIFPKKLNIQKAKIMASGPITSWQIDGEKNGNSERFYFLGLQNNCGQ